MSPAPLPSITPIALPMLLSAGGVHAAPEPAAEAPAAAQAPAEPVEQPVEQIAEPTTVAADAVIVGSALGPDQAATAPKPSYTTADTVYASASSAGRAGAIARVYWTWQDGTSHKEEEKPVDGDVVSFGFSQADGMRAGAYNVQIDIDDVPVGIADFQVQ
jgi:hypothetical protein